MTCGDLLCACSERIPEQQLEWCVKRAFEFLDDGDIGSALGTIVSDLGKHCGTVELPVRKFFRQMLIAWPDNRAHPQSEAVQAVRALISEVTARALLTDKSST